MKPSAAVPNRFLHTMLRVGDLERSVRFYCLLGMKVLRREDHPDAQFSLCFIGYGAEASHSVLELTYNYGQSAYTQGSAFGHIALAVDDIQASCAALAGQGVRIVYPPTPREGCHEVIAFLEDPDGYRVELIERS